MNGYSRIVWRPNDFSIHQGIKNSKNISTISPKVLGGIRVGGHDVLLVGVNFISELKMKQWWQIFGQAPKDEHELLLGSDAAKVLSVDTGGSILIKGESFKVAGILGQTGSQDDSLLFVSLKKGQSLLGKEGKISLVEVAALCSGCPIADMVTQIAEKLPDARVSAIQQVVEGRLKALGQFRRFSYAMAAVVLFIGSLIVFVTMMGSVNERTTEIGVFRAIGFRKSHIMRIILLEAFLVSLLAGILGYAFGMVGAKVALPFMAESGDAQLLWDSSVAFGAVGLAVALGVVASIYPALHASRMDPTEALRAL